MTFKWPRACLLLALVLWSPGLSNTELVPDDVGTSGDNEVPYVDVVSNTEESDATTQQQPHLILIVADDLGWNDVSWHNPEVLSPHLDQLAAEGMILNRSYVQPICTPTRSALLASRYPFTMGRQNNVIFPLAPTGLSLNVSLLPQELKKLGYDTHAVGKWHLGFCKEEYIPTSRGFDSFFGFYTGREDYYSHVLEENYSDGVAEDRDTQDYLEYDGIGHLASGYDFRDNKTVDRNVVGNYSAFVFADRVSSLLAGRNNQKPLFLYLPFQSVHAPLQVPQKYSDLYNYIEDRNRRTYLGMVTAMDEAVGKVVASLKATGHYDNSVIVFTTDNGGPTLYGGNNSPLRGNKSTLWEGGTRGSAFIHSPRLNSPGTVSNRMIHVTDWFPTFLHLARGSSPAEIDGVNQWEVLNNSSLADARDYFVYDIDDTNGLRAAVRWNKYKLIVGNPGPGEWTPPPSVDNQNWSEANTATNISADVKHDDYDETSNETNLGDLEASDHVADANNQNNLNVGEQKLRLDKMVVEKKYKDSSDHSFLQDAVIYLSRTENDLDPAFNSGKRGRARTALTRAHTGLTPSVEINEETTTVTTERKPSDDEEDVDVPTRVERKVRRRKIQLQRKRQHLEETRRLKGVLSSTHKVADLSSVSQLLNSKVKFQLYDVMADPTERNDLSVSHPSIVKLLLTRLYDEFPRYVAKDVPPSDARADPINFNSTWSPGWC